MTHSEFARYLDATNLKLDASDSEICSLCDEAAEAGYASVCVYPTSVSICSSILYPTPVNVCTVIGFPHGRSSFEAKREEIVRASDHGANEVDIVMNYAALRAGEKSLVTEEIAKLTETARSLKLLTKIIVETCYLNEAQKEQALNACELGAADFIKTSTGFGAGGATVDDIRLFRDKRTGPIKIKASGGIRTLEDALAMIDAGAERLGVSAASSLMAAMQGMEVAPADSSY
ncbi:deoxyribose-phosphate aldolase [Coraliomargarita parva]|uniref:deoxyribose-phosphate aldolase n=1 Tax=Coraliomargarita parva TaxID=3014050 RepID=UPI0022B376E0|nr:deoxyribose-phosphate aldolase [Coraliomargarita parva]